MKPIAFSIIGFLICLLATHLIGFYGSMSIMDMWFYPMVFALGIQLGGTLFDS